MGVVMKFIFALSFFCFFYFLYYVLVAFQKGEDFSSYYKLMVVSCAVCMGMLLYHFA